MSAMKQQHNQKILLTGAGGQLGAALKTALRAKYGIGNVIASDIRRIEDPNFEVLNVMDADKMLEIVQDERITQIYHLAAILSAAGERKPRFTWDINMNGLINVLETARISKVERVYFPSSIAIHGHRTPIENTPQYAIFDPSTVYGISKLAGELWAEYYFKKYNLDVRSLRYPGLISHETLPGGGTTDYAVDIFYRAIQGEDFECFLEADTRLPMMYMPDAIRATLLLMDAPSTQISVRSSYNLHAMSFTPAEIAHEIKKHYSNFNIHYSIDPLRQNIANSWSNTIDDSSARNDWNWQEEYDLSQMVVDMLEKLTAKLPDQVQVA